MDSHFHFIKEAMASANTYHQETEQIRDFFSDPSLDLEEFILQSEENSIGCAPQPCYVSNIRLSWSKFSSLN